MGFCYISFCIWNLFLEVLPNKTEGGALVPLGRGWAVCGCGSFAGPHPLITTSYTLWAVRQLVELCDTKGDLSHRRVPNIWDALYFFLGGNGFSRESSVELLAQVQDGNCPGCIGGHPQESYRLVIVHPYSSYWIYRWLLIPVTVVWWLWLTGGNGTWRHLLVMVRLLSEDIAGGNCWTSWPRITLSHWQETNINVISFVDPLREALPIFFS